MSRYNNTPNITSDNISGKGTTVYNVPPESVDDIYLISTLGDRFDILANEYYGNTEYWWVIAVANPHVSRKNFVINQGVQLRIPVNIEDIVAKFQEKNAQNQL